MKFKKITALLMGSIITISAFTFAGCEADVNNNNNEETTTTTQEVTTTTAPQDTKLMKEISDCVAVIAKADKTNALKDELKKYPEYYINSPNGWESLDELKRCIKENFYTCDTEYNVLSAEDVTDEYKETMEEDIKENHNATVDIQQVAVADIDYKYTNYSTDNYIDDTDFLTETQYFIKIDGVWYYGWGIDQNMEHEEIDA